MRKIKWLLFVHNESQIFKLVINKAHNSYSLIVPPLCWTLTKNLSLIELETEIRQNVIQNVLENPKLFGFKDELINNKKEDTL